MLCMYVMHLYVMLCRAIILSHNVSGLAQSLIANQSPFLHVGFKIFVETAESSLIFASIKDAQTLMH